MSKSIPLIRDRSTNCKIPTFVTHFILLVSLQQVIMYEMCTVCVSVVMYLAHLVLCNDIIGCKWTPQLGSRRFPTASWARDTLCCDWLDEMWLTDIGDAPFMYYESRVRAVHMVAFESLRLTILLTKMYAHIGGGWRSGGGMAMPRCTKRFETG